ncbi:hypothetical protein Clacol_009570 [Clathrus columnatus]|uniref:Sugar phosphate transporter domain-containing protein n=1 Tax=Clathrus columnatus TaxID=1419009 RepID=A0AAV5ARD0_9AGAM|nr:hypothetical protein Clacol_009570 [Clathrus columnatus]
MHRFQMVFVNKMVLNSAPDLTILFMFFQSMMTVLLLHLTSHLSSAITTPKINLTTARKLAPLIIVDAAGFMFNALCLRDVEAAFYQVARGLVLPLTILTVAVHARTPPSLKVCGCAAVVTLGFLTGVSPSELLPERSVLTPIALLYGFLSSMSIALHTVMIKTSLPHVNGSPTELSYWSNLGAGVIVGLVALLKGEVTEFISKTQDLSWDWTTFAWGNLVTGVVGFMISIAGILSVKVTSPVTHMFSSAARSVIQVAIGVKFFEDVLTVLYTWVKSTESSPPSSESTTTAKAKANDIESQPILMEERKTTKDEDED